MGASAMRLALFAGAAALSACGGDARRGAPGEGAFGFIVVGDAPSNKKDEEMLAEAVPMIRASLTPFVIHLGDYKGGRTPCTDEYDEAFAQLVDELKPAPVFYTPGDNEWTDCDRNNDEETGRPHSELDRLEVVRERFFAEPPQTPDAMQYRQQETQIENASWTYKGVRFLTIHAVGTNNGRNWVAGDSLSRAALAVEARDAANLAWLAEGFRAAREEEALGVVVATQADPVQNWTENEDKSCNAPDIEPIRADGVEQCDSYFELREALRDEALSFDGPVLVIHGNTAPFTLNQDFDGEDAPNLWRLNAAGDSGIGRNGLPYGTRDVTYVTFDPSRNKPFSAVGLLTGKAPKRK